MSRIIGILGGIALLIVGLFFSVVIISVVAAIGLVAWIVWRIKLNGIHAEQQAEASTPQADVIEADYEVIPPEQAMRDTDKVE